MSNSCNCYQKDGDTEIISQVTSFGVRWGASANTCGVINFNVTNTGETDCDPTNGPSGENDCSVAAILPVELVSFKATLSDGSINLIWITAYENDNKGFEIEHSLTGRDWQVIDFFPGNGASFEEHNYSYSHQPTAPGLHYYRLKQIDFDGGFEYSKTVSVEANLELDGLFFFPNPVNAGQSINLRTSSEDFESGELIIFDLNGKAVFNQIINSLTKEIDIASLSKGMYTAKFVSGRQQLTEKLILN